MRAVITKSERIILLIGACVVDSRTNFFRLSLPRSLECFQETLEISKRNFGKKNEKVADTLYSIGLVHQKLGQFQDSLESYSSALKVRTLYLFHGPLFVIDSHASRGSNSAV